MGDLLDEWAPVLRLKSRSGESLDYADINVTPLKGDELIATAEDVLDTLPDGQGHTVGRCTAGHGGSDSFSAACLSQQESRRRFGSFGVGTAASSSGSAPS